MKTSVIGSRTLNIQNLANFLPKETTEIVSGGAKGIDTCARNYAIEHNLKLTEFLPDYRRYGKGAPLKRNIEIIIYADFVLIFWDGKSAGTHHVIEQCKLRNIPFQIHAMDG